MLVDAIKLLFKSCKLCNTCQHLPHVKVPLIQQKTLDIVLYFAILCAY